MIAFFLLSREITEMLSPLPTLLLIEAAFIFIVGSKVRKYVFHSEEKWSVENYDTSRRKALPYFLLGLLLFIESLGLSFVFV
jgi:hypothetical protein